MKEPLFKSNIIPVAFVIFGMGLTVWMIMFGLQGDIFLDSISDVAGKHGHYWEGVFLGLCFSLFYIIGGLYSMKLFSIKNKIAMPLYVIGCAVYFITFLIPFLPNEYPFLADAHDITARIALGILLLTTLFFVIMLYKKSIALATVSLITYLASTASAIVLVCIHGTCIIAETIIQLFLLCFIVISVLCGSNKKQSKCK